MMPFASTEKAWSEPAAKPSCVCCTRADVDPNCVVPSSPLPPSVVTLEPKFRAINWSDVAPIKSICNSPGTVPDVPAAVAVSYRITVLSRSNVPSVPNVKVPDPTRTMPKLVSMLLES